MILWGSFIKCVKFDSVLFPSLVENKHNDQNYQSNQNYQSYPNYQSSQNFQSSDNFQNSQSYGFHHLLQLSDHFPSGSADGKTDGDVRGHTDPRPLRDPRAMVEQQGHGDP